MTRLLPLLLFLLIGLVAYAEDTPPPGATTPEAGYAATGPFGCEAIVTFRWLSSGVPSSTPAPETTPGSVGQEGVAGIVKAQGDTEELAKKTLESRGASEKSKAMGKCKDLHENLSGCVAAKYASSASVLSTLSFAARLELEKAIQADCQKQSGNCIDASIGTITCRVLPKTSEAGGSKTPEAKEGEKDKKKK